MDCSITFNFVDIAAKVYSSNASAKLNMGYCGKKFQTKYRYTLSRLQDQNLKLNVLGLTE